MDASDQHYWTARPDAPSRPGRVELLLPDVHLTLSTDRGVFSADHIDRGTRVLLMDGPPPRPPAPELVAQGSEADLLQQFNSALSLRATIRGDVSDAHAALTALPLVTEVQTEELPGGDAMLSISLERDEPEVIASALVAAGVSLRRLEAGHNQLEGLFLEVTSGKGVPS